MFVKKQAIIKLRGGAELEPNVIVVFTGDERLTGLIAKVVRKIEANGLWEVELLKPSTGLSKIQVNIKGEILQVIPQ